MPVAISLTITSVVMPSYHHLTMSSLCGQYPLDTAGATNAILLPPTGRDNPGAEDTQQRVVRPTLKPDLKASVAGQPITSAHERTLKVLKQASQGEGEREGFHRGTTHERQRTGHLSMLHLLAYSRTAQNLERCKKWLDHDRYGSKGHGSIYLRK